MKHLSIEQKRLKARIYQNSVEARRILKDSCREENQRAKWHSRDCYPERDLGCYMKRFKEVQA